MPNTQTMISHIDTNATCTEQGRILHWVSYNPISLLLTGELLRHFQHVC